MPMTREELIKKLDRLINEFGIMTSSFELPVVNDLREVRDYLQSSHEETEALKKELSAVRSLALKNDARASDADQYEQWLLEIGKQIGCQHLDEQLPNCVIQALQGDTESSHEAELVKFIEEIASGHCALDVFCKNIPTRGCIHNKARELLNKIKGED